MTYTSIKHLCESVSDERFSVDLLKVEDKGVYTAEVTDKKLDEVRRGTFIVPTGSAAERAKAIASTVEDFTSWVKGATARMEASQTDTMPG